MREASARDADDSIWYRRRKERNEVADMRVEEEEEEDDDNDADCCEVCSPTIVPAAFGGNDDNDDDDDDDDDDGRDACLPSAGAVAWAVVCAASTSAYTALMSGLSRKRSTSLTTCSNERPGPEEDAAE